MFVQVLVCVVNYFLRLAKKKRLVLGALPDLAPSPYPLLSCLCPPTNCLATSLYSDIGLRSPTEVATKIAPGTSSTISHPFQSRRGRFLGGGVLFTGLGIKGPERYLAGISLWVHACLHTTWVPSSYILFTLLAAPSLQSSVRQRLTEPQLGLGSQRLVEGEAGHFLTSRVSLRRMRSLSSGQSFSSEGHGTSPPSASASSSCSSSTTTIATTTTSTTTTTINTVHVHPVYYHHSTSYFLQMDPYPDPTPSDNIAVMSGHSESLGYQLSLFSFFLPFLLLLPWPLPAACCCLLTSGRCGGESFPVLSFLSSEDSLLRSA